METISIIKEKFDFLITEFDFKVSKLDKKNNSILYLSKIAGIKIDYELRDGYLSIMIYKLVDGVFVDNPIIITPETKLTGFNFDDILEIINNKKLIMPLYSKGSINPKYKNKSNGLELYISDLANNFKKYGKDVIKGNFEVFQKANSIVKNRVLTLN